MPITPETTPLLPNAVYAPQIVLGMSIDKNGAPKGQIQMLTLRGAHVDAETGAWTPAAGQGSLMGIRFGFAADGSITGLPDDLAPLAPQIAAAWAAIVTVIGGVNAIRKLV